MARPWCLLVVQSSMRHQKTSIASMYKYIKRSCTGVDPGCFGTIVIVMCLRVDKTALDPMHEVIIRSGKLIVTSRPFVTLRKSSLMPSVGSVDLRHPALVSDARASHGCLIFVLGIPILEKPVFILRWGPVVHTAFFWTMESRLTVL